jgi:hypothetical protein
MTRNCDEYDQRRLKCITINSGDALCSRQPGKKTDERTMVLPSPPEFNPMAVAESSKTQILTLVTAKETSDILINCKI